MNANKGHRQEKPVPFLLPARGRRSVPCVVGANGDRLVSGTDRPHRSPALVIGLEALMAIRRLSADLGVDTARLTGDSGIDVVVAAATCDRGMPTEQLVHHDGGLADVAGLYQRQILGVGRGR
jgi:hypothetical protein